MDFYRRYFCWLSVIAIVKPALALATQQATRHPRHGPLSVWVLHIHICCCKVHKTLNGHFRLQLAYIEHQRLSVCATLRLTAACIQAK